MPLRPFAVALLLVLAACAAPPAEPPAPPPTLGRWTERFLEPSLLLADEIEVVGPPAMRSHLVVAQDPESIVSVAKATDDGFLQVVSARDGARAEIRAHLDNWELVALRGLRVLERPGEVDVVVRARGSVVLQSFAAGAAGPQRAPELELRGALER